MPLQPIHERENELISTFGISIEIPLNGIFRRNMIVFFLILILMILDIEERKELRNY